MDRMGDPAYARPMFAVDHQERRRRISEAAIALIAEEGLEAATIRRIAGEVGDSTKIVTHYFASKQELLLEAFELLAGEAFAKIDRLLARDPADLVGALMIMAAADETGVRHWRLYLSFWEWAVRDPETAASIRVYGELAIARIAAAIEARNGPRTDRMTVARTLNALVQGISLQALVDPEGWPTETVREVLDLQVGQLLGLPLPVSG